MFKSWSKKNKIKAVFKLQFQATQVPKMKKNALMVSLVPDDVGKPTVKLAKAPIQDGTCLWENPIFELVKLVRDSKSGKLHEKIYHFIVSTGTSKSGYLGEASIDFADFAAEIEPLTVDLPLKFANSGVVLHVTIQNVEGYTAERNGEDNGSVGLYSGGSLTHQLSFGSNDESYHNVEEGHLGKNRSGYSEQNASNGVSPVVASWEDSSSNRQNSMPANGSVKAIATETTVHKRSNTDWSMGSTSDGSLGDWTNTLEDNLPRESLQELSSDNATEKLKSEISSLKRQAELLELELQSLRKQVEKESTRGQNLSRQIISLREERDELRTNYEQLKFQKSLNNESRTSKALKSEVEDTRLQLEAVKEEVVCEQKLSANLQLQLQKTQNSNCELVLAVKDLESMLEEKNKEILNLSTNIKSQNFTKEHEYATELKILKQKISDQNGEIDTYYMEREELTEQMKELDLEYELLKKENVDISLRLKQSEAEQIMLENEYSTSLGTIKQLESQVERLEEKIKMKEEEFSESLVCIKELENQAKSLEKELKIESEKFECDLRALQCAKNEQEERAIQAEEALRKTRHNNAISSERFQEEYRMLSVEMAMKVEENEKMAMKAVAEANELRQQNKLMEEMLQKCNQELRLITDQNELKQQELLKQIDSKGETIEKMSQELEMKSKQLEDAQRHINVREQAFSKQHQMLRSEVETFKIQHNEIKHSVHEEQGEKENMKKKISQLEGELKKKEAELSVMEKKLKISKGRGSRDNECAALPSSTKGHIKKSKADMHKHEKEMDAASTVVSKSEGRMVERSPHRSDGENHTSELLNEVAALKERNKDMESELKEMEERYSEISLKFAEVEGERQQLVMALRNLKNGKKN